MPLENKQIVAMASWTLEDFQDDPLGAVEKVRELAAAYLALLQERDAAVQDIQLISDRGVMCVACGNRNPEQEDPTIGCPKDDTCTYNGVKWSPNFVWRGPQKEEKRV